MTTEQLKHNAQQSASKYLRFAFDLKSTTFDECLEILTTAIYYDLPCANAMLDDMLAEYPSREKEIMSINISK